MLNMEEHGALMSRLFVRYQDWLWTWEKFMYDPEDQDEDALRAQTSALDGFFGLAPWMKFI